MRALLPLLFFAAPLFADGPGWIYSIACLPLADGYLKVGGSLEATQKEFAKFSARE